MPTSTEAYKSLLLKVNKNDTNSDIDINRGEFVLLYNEQKDVWLKNKISEKESSKSSQDLNELQVKRLELIKVGDRKDHSFFSLPENFFSYISSYSLCSANGCNGIVVRHFPMKPANENLILENSNTEPSIEFEEAPIDLSAKKLFVFKKDFEVDETFLSYYREVGKIDIAGYRKLDGSISTDIHPDIPSDAVNEIVNMCATEVIRRYENPEGFQLAKDREQQDK